MAEDALDKYIFASFFEDDAHKAELRFDAWIAMWLRIGNNYCVDFIIAVGLGEPMPSGYLPEVSEEFKRDVRAYLQSLGGDVEDQVQTQDPHQAVVAQGPGPSSDSE